MTRDELIAKIRTEEDNLLRDGGDYNYEEEWIPHKELDVEYLTSLMIELGVPVEGT